MEPIENVKALMDTAMAVQSQLNEALEILRKRDEQIGVAIDALNTIRFSRMKQDEYIEEADVAMKAILKMREIHDKPLSGII
jgi:hypothetical protein